MAAPPVYLARCLQCRRMWRFEGVSLDYVRLAVCEFCRVRVLFLGREGVGRFVPIGGPDVLTVPIDESATHHLEVVAALARRALGTVADYELRDLSAADHETARHLFAVAYGLEA